MTGDVVALDPVRLAHLECYLDTFATGCHRRAARIEEELAGTGFAAPEATALLAAVARWSETERLDIAWRRAVIQAMDVELPLTRVDVSGPELEDDARRIAERLERALAEEPPSWPVVERILTDVGRRLHQAEYAAVLLRYLGPEVARDLALRIEDSIRAHIGEVRAIPADEVEAYAAAQEVASRLVRVGVEVPAAEGGVDDTWLRQFLGLPLIDDEEEGAAGPAGPPAGLDPDEVSRIVGELGFGARMSAMVARALGRGTAAPILGVAGNVLGLVSATIDVVDGFTTDPACAYAQFGLAATATGTGLAAIVAPSGPGSLALAGVSFLARQAANWVGDQCDEDDDDPAPPPPSPPGPGDRVDPGTGIPVYPGGGTDSPYQDGAGGPLPPNMTRGG